MQDIIRHVSRFSYLSTQQYHNCLTLRLHGACMTIYVDPGNFRVLFPLGGRGTSTDASEYIKEEDGEQYLKYMNIRAPGHIEDGMFTMNASDSGEVIAVINCFIRIQQNLLTFRVMRDVVQNTLEDGNPLLILLSNQNIFNRPGPGGCVGIP